MLIEPDHEVRGALTRFIAAHGFAPATAELALATGLSEGETQDSLIRLADAKAILLHPNTAKPWVVHPFSLSPSSCWVETQQRGYWASCLYCGFGIAAALNCEANISTRYGGEAEPVCYRVGSKDLEPTTDIFHLSLPVRAWWDNVVHSCATFQPFRTAVDADDWCERHKFPKGAVLSIGQLWRFAADWYGDCLKIPWRKRSPDEVRAVFERNGLTGDFWAV